MNGAVARAFELAKDGPCRTIQEIGKQLAREGYPNAGNHLESVSLKKQLRVILKARAILVDLTKRN